MLLNSLSDNHFKQIGGTNCEADSTSGFLIDVQSLLTNNEEQTTYLCHIATVINNICNYYFPKVSHLYEFSFQLKKFLLERIHFDFEECEHTKKLTL